MNTPPLVYARRIATLVGAALLLSTAALAQQIMGPEAPAREAAPAFTLNSIFDDPVALADLKGAPVLLVFTALDCAPCKEAVPAITEFHSKYRRNGLIVILINRLEPRHRIVEFARKQGINYPVLLDRDGRVADAYQSFVTPTFCMIDADGRLAWKHYGFSEKRKSDIELSIRKTLGLFGLERLEKPW